MAHLEASKARYASVPERRDWCALEDCCNDESETGYDYPCIHHMAGISKRGTGDSKDPIVETSDRNLVEREDDLIHDVGSVEPFPREHTCGRL